MHLSIDVRWVLHAMGDGMVAASTNGGVAAARLSEGQCADISADAEGSTNSLKAEQYGLFLA
ncbi:MAG: hypothetical protein JWP89_6146 [Schlesneria sp.]|nr:hypothetical protein [Schlesneria sp.]